MLKLFQYLFHVEYFFTTTVLVQQVYKWLLTALIINELVGLIRYGEPVGSTTVNSLVNSLVRLELVGSVTNY